MVGLTQGADARKYLGEDHTRIVGKHELMDYIKSDYYTGGLIDELGGQIHPLALNRGLIYGFCQNGGSVYEQTEVISIEEKEDGIYVHTANAVVKAKSLWCWQYTMLRLNFYQSKTIPLFRFIPMLRRLPR